LTEDPILLISTLVFVLVTMVFALTYHKKISYAQKEYNVAKEVVSGIVLTFKRSLEKQNETINGVAYDVEGLQSTVEKRENQNRVLQVKIDNLTKSLTSVFMINKKVVSNIISMDKKIDELKAADQELGRKVEALEEGYKKTLQKPETGEPPVPRPTSTRITSTEEQIIQILVFEGAKTAPDIEKRIGKTREHTSRLMKKLWREGYVERDTYAIPFIYRPTKELEKRIKEVQTQDM